MTYYFAADGIEENQSALEEYLVSVGKLIAKEDHHMGIMTLQVSFERVL